MGSITFAYFDHTLPSRAVLLLSVLSRSNRAEKANLGAHKWRWCYLTHLIQGINLRILFGWSLGSLDKACGGLHNSEWHLVQLAHLSHMWLISRKQKSLNFASKILSWGRCLYPSSWAGSPLCMYTDIHSVYLRKVPLLCIALAAAFISSVACVVWQCLKLNLVLKILYLKQSIHCRTSCLTVS